jgi:8-oxo-dGTP pyrophosphatase MutT (NUDIX family)
MKMIDLDKLKKNLPANPGIQGEEYFSSVVLLLLVPVNGEYHILLEKRAPSIRQGGEISLPGGMSDESDSSLEATAIRETAEEVGIAAEKIRIVGRLDSVFAPMGAIVNVVVGVADIEPAEIKRNPEEVEKAFLVPVSFFERSDPEVYTVVTEVHPSYIDKSTGEEVTLFPAKELGLPKRYWNTWGGFRHKVFVYKTDEGTIWGLTARILVDFAKKLNLGK